jgi:hypothetical protein
MSFWCFVSFDLSIHFAAYSPIPAAIWESFFLLGHPENAGDIFAKSFICIVGIKLTVRSWSAPVRGQESRAPISIDRSWRSVADNQSPVRGEHKCFSVSVGNRSNRANLNATESDSVARIQIADEQSTRRAITFAISRMETGRITGA